MGLVARCAAVKGRSAAAAAAAAAAAITIVF